MRSADSYRQGWPIFAIYACEMDACGGLPKRHIKFCIEVPEDALSRYGNPPTLPWLRHVFADGGYAGQKLGGAIAWDGDGTIGIIKRSDAAKGLEIIPRDGSSSSPSHSSSDAAAWRKTGKRSSLPQLDGRWSRLAACSPEEPQDTAMLDKIMDRALIPLVAPCTLRVSTRRVKLKPTASHSAIIHRRQPPNYQ